MQKWYFESIKDSGTKGQFMSGPENIIREDFDIINRINSALNNNTLDFQEVKPLLLKIYLNQMELMDPRLNPANDNNSQRLVDEIRNDFNQLKGISQELSKNYIQEELSPETLSLNGMLRGAALSIENQLERLNHQIRDTLANFGIETQDLTINRGQPKPTPRPN